MIFGAITNSWRQQLDGQDLALLVQEAQTRGARHIELRQTCLGQYEHGEGEHWRPVLSRLASLVQAFPALTFDPGSRGYVEPHDFCSGGVPARVGACTPL